LLEREKNSSCVRVVNEASGIQEGEREQSEPGREAKEVDFNKIFQTFAFTSTSVFLYQHE
jgi:hypothetical protein